MYFHLNHPIRYVCVVGVIVAIDDINVKYSVLTIDDGSGANIELKIVRVPPGVSNPAGSSSITRIANVNVISQFGLFDIMIDDQRVDVGTVIKAKGTISEFRGVKQMDLNRVWIVTTTNDEAHAWSETASFKQNTLSVPWHLSSTDGKRIKSDIRAERKKLHDYNGRVAEYEAKKRNKGEVRAVQLAQRQAKLEIHRQREEAIMNAGALK